MQLNLSSHTCKSKVPSLHLSETRVVTWNGSVKCTAMVLFKINNVLGCQSVAEKD